MSWLNAVVGLAMLGYARVREDLDASRVKHPERRGEKEKHAVLLGSTGPKSLGEGAPRRENQP